MLPERRIETLGRYRLRRLLGRGGMASVYLAQAVGPSGFERWVALKVIHPQYSDDQRFVQMFLDEARLSARLYHQNVCSVFDSGEVDGTHYIAMEYLHGEPLNRVVERSLPLELAVRVVVDAARGLHAAHELRDERGELLGLVHRDVSPHNVMVLYDGLAKVVDFGIARARDRLVETTTGSVKGKLAYMAPEQIEASAVDRRTDVYALGIVLWEATLGWRLFKRDNAAATMRAALDEPVPLPSKIRPGYPEPLERVVMRALERDREARWQTIEELADALETCLEERAAAAVPTRLRRWMNETFADARAERDAVLAAPASDPDLSDEGGAAGGRSTGVELIHPAESGDQGSTLVSVVSMAARLRQRRAGTLLVGALAVLAVVGAVVGWRLLDAEPTDPHPEGAASALAALAAPLPEARTDRDAGDGAPDGAPSEISSEAGAPADAGPPGDEPTVGTPRQPQPRAGYLNVMSVPVAEVWMGAKRLGTTPLRKARVPAGRHALKLRSVGGVGQKSVTVQVRPGETSYVSLSLGE